MLPEILRLAYTESVEWMKWAEAHFFIGRMAGNREAIIEKITGIAERVTALLGLEVQNVELAGGGRNRVLRVYVDRPPAPGQTVPVDQPFGVTLDDCQNVSDKLSEILDADPEIIPGEGYQLEVSSPGAERKLLKPRDFERFQGHKVKIRLREPMENQTVWRGTLAGCDGDSIQLSATAPVKKDLTIGLAQIERANIEFRW